MLSIYHRREPTCTILLMLPTEVPIDASLFYFPLAVNNVFIWDKFENWVQEKWLGSFHNVKLVEDIGIVMLHDLIFWRMGKANVVKIKSLVFFYLQYCSVCISFHGRWDAVNIGARNYSIQKSCCVHIDLINCQLLGPCQST